MAITAAQTTSFDVVVKGLIDNWLKIKPSLPTLSNAFKFFQLGVDSLVQLAEQCNLDGADKKALVEQAAHKLFESVVTPLLPMWAKPFSYLINQILNQLIDATIEYIVTKLPKNNVPVVPVK